MLALARFLREEPAPLGRGHAQHVEERRAHQVALDPLGGLAAAQVRVPPLEAHEVAERRPGLRLPVDQVRGRHVREVDAVEVPRGLVDPDEPRLVREVEGPQHHGVEDVEDRRVGREPERQRRDQQQAGRSDA